MNDISLSIDNSILNIFSSKELKDIIKELKLTKYFELTQIHSNIVHIVDNKYINNQEGDSLITNLLNTPILIKVADCVPILLFDKKRKVIAVVHSGWKGTLEDIASKTIEVMIDQFKCNIKEISAYIYPSIRKCHFEVEEDVFSKFKEKIKDINKYTKRKNNKYYIDIQSIIKDRLNDMGVKNIIDTNICTYCHHDKYHSYRYNHTTKRNILLAMIKE